LLLWAFDTVPRYTLAHFYGLGLGAAAVVSGRVYIRRRYRTIHNGIERLAVPAPSRRESLRRELGLGPGDVVVGSVGNLRAPKAYGDLLDALSRLAPEFPSLTAVIVGDGPMAEELRARAEELGLGRRVRWLGRRSDVADLYGVMDVYVLSSRREGFPMALIEAAAACVPIVATDVGGVSEIVRPGETGLLAPAGDPPRLADAVRTLLEDRALADGMARSTEALYLEVLGRSSDAPAGARRRS
jgi:glycosyltransferase involved in cell wall biosynthesis